MPTNISVNYDSLERYRRSAGKAQFADLMGKMTGTDTDLVSYDLVAKRLKARQQIEAGTQSIPLSQIVGSVGRYRDFTRTFLPRSGVNAERWARVDAIMHSMEGWAPIEVYKLGEVYFVRDGNHRVSVARANGLTYIEAFVTELATDVDLTLDDFARDQWIIKVEHTEFLQETELDKLRPDNNVILTEPGRYPILLRHIQVHQYFRNLDLDREGSDERLDWQAAVVSWYDTIYQPVVQAIHSHDLLDAFPSRTEADLYLWIAYHREELARRYDLAPLSVEAAVSTFAEVYSERPLQQAVKSIKFGWHKAVGDLDKPLGMSAEEFDQSRARHTAGERTLSEAEADQAEQPEEGLDSDELDPTFEAAIRVAA